MQKVITIIILLIATEVLYGQIPKKLSRKMGMFPMIFLDSTETNMAELNTLSPFKISNITILTPKKAKKTLGDKGSDGAVYVTTVEAAKLKNWTFFKSKSDSYSRLINSPQADTIVQYVLNSQILSDSSAAGSLFLINEKNLKSLQVIDKENEKSDYPTSKRFIILIAARHPKKGLLKMSKSD